MKSISLVILLSLFSCKPSLDRFQIDTSVEKELELNKKADETNYLFQEDYSYFFFSSEETGGFFEEQSGMTSIQEMLAGTEEILAGNVCACQLKNDTITVSGGFFYGGGIGYEVKIHKNEFDGKIIVASNSNKYKKDGAFVKSLHLSSKRQNLYFTESPVFKLDSTIKGKIVMESEVFQIKKENGLARDQYSMKVLFQCKLSKFSPF